LVRRLLLILLAALVAVAVPVAADEEPEPAPECQPLDLLCDEGNSGGPDPTQTSSCKPYEINSPTNGPVTETVLIDPDGCYREKIRHALGWPPSDQALLIDAYDSFVDLVFGS
jgi:hypothetical protein